MTPGSSLIRPNYCMSAGRSKTPVSEIVAPFHIHRRQPANFSLIDYRLHNPSFAWHLIISLRDARRSAVQPFRVRKNPDDDFGITEHDQLEGSQLAYGGPEVLPLSLSVYG